jgi:hypothetical protein
MKGATMTDPITPPPATDGTPPPEGSEGAPAPDANAEIIAALKELGVEPDADGKIDPADHVKLVTTVKTLREQVKTHEAAERKLLEEQEEARKKALPEQERLIEEARQAGREEALAESRVQMIETLVTATATASNLADPADVKVMLGDLSALADEAAVKKAVAKLAADKPYLLKPQAPGAKLEQGPRGTAKSGSGDDFIRASVSKRRAG